MSPVEIFYQTVQKHLGGTRPYHSLHPMEQMQLIQAINTIIGLTQGEPVND